MRKSIIVFVLVLGSHSAPAVVTSTLAGPDFIPGCIMHHLTGSLTLDVEDSDGYDTAHDISLTLENGWGAVKGSAGVTLLTSTLDRMTGISWGGGPYDVSNTYKQETDYCVYTHDDYELRVDFLPSLTVSLYDFNCDESPSHGTPN